MDNLKPRGGARSGAGRKIELDPAKMRCMRLNENDWTKLKLLGSAKWIREQLAKVKL